MKVGDSCGKCDCGGTLKVAGEWGNAWVLQCFRCQRFAFKFMGNVTNDPADTYDRSLIADREATCPWCGEKLPDRGRLKVEGVGDG